MKHSITYHTVSFDIFEKTDLLIKKNEKTINKYIEQLVWWNNRINLVSRDVPRETIRKHIHHSLLISTFSVFKQANRVVDAGTGGGLPGLPLAITHPNKQFMLNDIVSKKIMAVKQMKRELTLNNNVKTSSNSIGKLQIDKEFLLISKHAFKINDLYNLAAHLPWTAIALYKSIDITGELEGIEIPLNIAIHKLYPNSSNSFYKGKGIVIINRSH